MNTGLQRISEFRFYMETFLTRVRIYDLPIIIQTYPI